MGTRISKRKILAAIPDSGGILTIIAGRLDCSWSTAQRAIESYPETKQAYTDEQERILDLAESKLYDSIQKGESQDIKWFLAKKGKRRGYVDSVENKHEGQVEIVVTYGKTNDQSNPA